MNSYKVSFFNGAELITFIVIQADCIVEAPMVALRVIRHDWRVTAEWIDSRCTSVTVETP